MQSWINRFKSLVTDIGKPCLLTVFVLIISSNSESIHKIYLPLIIWISGNALLSEISKVSYFASTYEQQIKEVKEKRQKVKNELLGFFSGLSNQTANDFVETISADEEKLTMFMLLKKHGIVEKSRPHPVEKLLSSVLGCLIGIICFIPSKLHPIGYVISSILACLVKTISNNQKKFNIEEFVWSVSITISVFSIYYYGF